MKKKEIKFIVEQEMDLVRYMSAKGIAKNKVKTYIKLGYVSVNKRIIQKLPYSLKIGDTLEIQEKRKTTFDIVYEDTNYLIINKKAGLLTISTSNTAKNYEDTLYRRVREYLNSKKEYAFIVNRIDKETSGLVVFVKSEKLKNELQSNWNDIVKKRGYIAVVSGRLEKKGRIDNYLYEDKLTFSHSTKTGGKRAITNYQTIKTNKKYTMLDIQIETGRKNQIRVHMSEMNHPIVGDKKYGSKDNSLKRLALHHYEISFIDPITKKLLTFTSKVPKDFYDLFD